MVGILDDPDKSAKFLVEVMKAGGQMNFAGVHDWQEAGLRDRVKEWLEKVRQLAQEFSPEGYSLSLNIPFGVSLGFSWTAPAKREDSTRTRWT